MRGIRWLYRLNALWKSAALKREYANTKMHYSRLPAGKTTGQLLAERLGERRKPLRQRSRLRVLFLGTDELQDRGGILQALEHLADLSWFTRADGAYGQNYPGSPRDRRSSNSRRLLDQFITLAQSGRIPDVLVAQTWASYISPGILEEVRSRYGTVIVNIGMDDRHQYRGEKIDGDWGGTCGLIPALDLALTAAPECVEWYTKEGCPAIFFPEASDSTLFRPMPELAKIHDVCFVGARYGVRERIVLALRKAGVKVTAFGSGWAEGRLAVSEAPKLFAQSRIVLGVGTIGHCDDFYALKLRDFDGPMSGSLYLTHDNPDLRLVYDVEKEIVTYRDIPDCIAKTRHYLAHDEERESIARRGRERAASDHTWDRRFATLFAQLRGG